MNKIIIASVFIALLSGCGRGFDSDACRVNVKEKMQTLDVVNAPERKYEFIVRTKDGSVYLVKTMNPGDNEITSKEKIFESNK